MNVKIDLTTIIAFVLGGASIGALLWFWKKSPFATPVDTMHEVVKEDNAANDNVPLPPAPMTPIVVVVPRDTGDVAVMMDEDTGEMQGDPNMMTETNIV